MTADAWPRLGFVAACSAYVVGLVVVWQQLGWPAATAALAGGTLLALLLSVERSGPPQQQTARTAAAGLASVSTNQIDDELKRRARAGEVPVATRRGRPLASVDDTDSGA